MCGIAGCFRLDGGPAAPEPMRAMRAALRHRGPDDEGEWVEGPVALGFCRLSILDLSGGHQPMALQAQGHRPLVIVFNGEIYNHPALKAELEAQGERYRTRSDTETVLRLYRRDGLAAAGKLEGMFAFAVYDGERRELALARDGVGVKPLYYAFVGETLYFASELRALVAGGVGRELDTAGVLDYLARGTVHAPRTALARVEKLPPGHTLRAGPQGLRIEKYWELRLSGAPRRRWEAGEALGELERLLRASVRGQLLADVPVGAFLSGGVDSSVVAALMTQESGARVKTFSIGFRGARAGLDESEHARAVARHLGTEHHELTLPDSVLDGLQELALGLDEPVADSAILPTLLLSRFARSEVKVVLTGEGADELFAGYGRYKAAYLSERLLRLPQWSQGVAASVARRLGRGRWFEGLPLATVRDWAKASAHGSLQAGALCRPEFLARAERPSPLDWLGALDEPHSLEQALAYDLRTVLCDSLLMKVDKATMRASLEARVPFLDRSVIEFAFGLPASFKLRRMKGKYLLRRLAERWLPSSIAWRRKHGFLVPWEEWVRRPDNGVLDELIRLPALGEIFDPARLLAARERLVHGGGPADAGLFFRVAVFALWLDSLRGPR